jgi:hypothetical protein
MKKVPVSLSALDSSLLPVSNHLKAAKPRLVTNLRLVEAAVFTASIPGP